MRCENGVDTGGVAATCFPGVGVAAFTGEDMMNDLHLTAFE